MKKLTNALGALALLFGLSVPSQAQENEKPYLTYPHMFVGLQGGVQTTLNDCSVFDVMTPTAAVSLGANFNRVVGTRLHVNGAWNQGQLKSGFKYDYKYITTDLDLLLNVTNLFRKGDDHLFNFIVLGGVGLNTAWANDDLNNAAPAVKANLPYLWDGTHLTHNARVGVQFNFNCSKALDFNIEVNANSLGDRYNSKMNNRDDWQITAMAGVAFKFGYKKRPAKVVEEPAPVVEEPREVVAPTPVVEKPAPVVEKKVEPVAPAKKEFEVSYMINKHEVTSDYQSVINEVVAFLKQNPKATVTITGYADKGTGNATINKRLSSQRVEGVKQALIKAGIDKSRIKSDYKGDTVQPFSENDRNRVVIGVAE